MSRFLTTVCGPNFPIPREFADYAKWSLLTAVFFGVRLQPCDVVSKDQLTCLSVNMRRHLVNGNAMKMNSNSPMRLAYGFMMDGVQSLRNITSMTLGDSDETGLISRATSREVRSPASFSTVPKYLTVYPDPELDSFSEVKQFYFSRNEYLNLNVSLIRGLLNY